MSDALKTKWLTAAVALLVLANVVTLSIFWVERRKAPAGGKLMPKGPAFEFLIKELAFDSVQIAAYEKLRSEHQQSQKPLNDAMREAKDSFFKLIAKPTVSAAEIDVALNAELTAQKNIDLNLLNHFKAVRQICKPAQQEKFDGLIQQIIRMIGQKRPGGPGNDRRGVPPPPHGEDMPPPPPDGEEPPR